MDIKQFGLYKVKDDYFNRFNDRFLVQNKNENRPFYCSFTDSNGIIWFIPLSSQVDSYRQKIEKDILIHGNCLYYHIVKVFGKQRVFLIGNMIPITSEYILDEYRFNNIHYVIENKKDKKEIEKRAKKYIALYKSKKIQPLADIDFIIKELSK